MRVDLFPTEHDAASFAAYLHGSAAVVRRMCLRAFLVEEERPKGRYDECAAGAARLGAAFQKLNWLFTIEGVAGV